MTAIEKVTSQTFCPVGERNGASPDDLTKWEVAMIAKITHQLDKKRKKDLLRNSDNEEK